MLKAIKRDIAFSATVSTSRVNVLYIIFMAEKAGTVETMINKWIQKLPNLGKTGLLN